MGHVLNDGTTPKAIPAVLLGLALMIPLSGCGGFASSPTPMGSTSQNVQRTTSAAYAMKIGAQNPMANDALQMTITNVERRPISTFVNANDSKTASSDGAAATDDEDNLIAVEIDMQYTFNPTTLSTNTEQAGGDKPGTPSTLSDVLLPGELMYITGKDTDGNEYIASDILTVNANNDTLGTNAQWDYSLLDSALPQAATKKSGSVIFEVTSTASDLTLHIITANDNSDPLDGEAVAGGNNYHYTLGLS